MIQSKKHAIPSESSWTESDTQKALEYWRLYQESHDVSDRIGQAAGIDPDTGEVHFGRSAAEIGKQLIAEQRFRPLFFVRVGYRTYGHKLGQWRLKAE